MELLQWQLVGGGCSHVGLCLHVFDKDIFDLLALGGLSDAIGKYRRRTIFIDEDVIAIWQLVDGSRTSIIRTRQSRDSD